MSTSAGQLTVDILARMDQFDQSLKAMEAKAAKAGAAAGVAAGASLGQKLGQQMQGQLQGMFAGIGNNVSMGLANALKSKEGDTELAEAFGQLFDSIPVVNVAYRLGRKVKNEIGRLMAGGATDEQIADISNKEAARVGLLRVALEKEVERTAQLREQQALVKEVNSAYSSQQEKTYGLIRAENERLTLAGEYTEETLSNLENVESERSRSRQDLLQDQLLSARTGDLETAYEAMPKARSADEAYSRARAFEIELAEVKRKSADDVLKLIEKEGAARQKIIDDQKKLEDEAAREAKERKIEDNEAIAAAMQNAEGEYADLASGDAQTALGTFKFEAYPPTMQKVIQERTMKAVEALAKQRNESAGVF